MMARIGLSLLASALLVAGGSAVVEQFSEQHERNGFFDSSLERLNEDGRHQHVQSAFEQKL